MKYTTDDIFTQENKTLEEILASIMAPKLNKISSRNQAVLERLREILQKHIRLKENSVYKKYDCRNEWYS